MAIETPSSRTFWGSSQQQFQVQNPLSNPTPTHRHNNHQSQRDHQPLHFDGQIHQYIRSQNEKLRIMLQQQTKQQVLALLKMMEPDVLYVLGQKDEQIAQAAKKKIELEQLLTRLESEKQLWRRVAQENESVVLSLHNTLEQVKERNRGVVVMAEDAESCCDENRGNRVMEEGTEKMVCKCCHSRSSSFMFLPCRHLCSCQACESFLQACPLCKVPKKTSIQTLIF